MIDGGEIWTYMYMDAQSTTGLTTSYSSPLYRLYRGFSFFHCWLDFEFRVHLYSTSSIISEMRYFVRDER